jgi:hypothetical protein
MLWVRGLSKTSDAWRAAGYTALLCFAAVLPLPLAALDLPIVGRTYLDRASFELLAFTGSSAILLIGFLEFRRQRPRGSQELWVALAPVVVGLQALLLVTEFSEPLYDYETYAAAAKSVLAGGSPYELKPPWHYLYPPLLAYGLGWAHGAVTAAGSLFGSRVPAAEAWEHVFFLFQCAQLLLVAGAFFLCRTFARRLDLPEPMASLLVATLLVINNPLVRALRWSQVNLWVLDLLLLAVLGVARFPTLAGIAAGVGAHLKVYPLVLLGPWILERRWRALTGVAIGLATFVIVIANAGRGWWVWRQFLEFAPTFPLGTFFRDNSLHSLVYNVAQASKYLLGFEVSVQAVNGVSTVLSILVLLYFAVRFFQRERAFEKVTVPNDFLRTASQAMDATAAGLIVSPLVWEHHYVLAIPIVLWAAAGWGAARPVAIGVVAVLIFAVPTFDIFPLSYHRLAGLVFMLWVTRPVAPPTT